MLSFYFRMLGLGNANNLRIICEPVIILETVETRINDCSKRDMYKITKTSRSRGMRQGKALKPRWISGNDTQLVVVAVTTCLFLC